MKKIIIAICVAVVLSILAFGGANYVRNANRPDLNGNEKIVSKSIDGTGNPEGVLGKIPELKAVKDLEKVYISIPVNNKKIKQSKVLLSNNGKDIEKKTIDVSKAGYVTYVIDNLKDREKGNYQLAFYDTHDEINVYAALEIQ